jgi:Mce-associated membrane protein
VKAFLTNRATVLPLLSALLVLILGCAFWFGYQAHTLTAGDASANTAVVDVPETHAVADQVGSGVKAIFSYDYTNIARTERAAADVLVDAAVNQYRDSFAAAKKQAEDQKLVRATTVRSIGVREIRGDQATVLLFLDQQTLHATNNQQESTGAQLDITAKRVDGKWKIASLTAL